MQYRNLITGVRPARRRILDIGGQASAAQKLRRDIESTAGKTGKKAKRCPDVQRQTPIPRPLSSPLFAFSLRAGFISGPRDFRARSFFQPFLFIFYVSICIGHFSPLSTHPHYAEISFTKKRAVSASNDVKALGERDATWRDSAAGKAVG